MSFNHLLIKWYNLNKRDLPWRKTSHPYPIWISEVILQQTRVTQGLPYYERFMKRFPTVYAIAHAQEQEVLNLWQGLGYYSRARNLHAGTKQVVFDLNGVFPNNYNDWLKIKGVGSYTAAAIASFAFKEPVPVVDGNVFRVLSRVFDIDLNIASQKSKKYFFDFSKELIDKNKPDIYNQAIMEFGALQCIPNNPNCNDCVLQNTCIAFSKNIVSQRPIKISAKKIRKRYFHYFIIIDDNSVYLKKRIKKDIWQNMYEFPMLETKNEHLNKEFIDGLKINLNDITLIKRNPKHILSHQEIYVAFWLVNTYNHDKITADAIKVPFNEIENYPMPKPIFKFIDFYLAETK
jgi:A/G-specific adenine glycosylase